MHAFLGVVILLGMWNTFVSGWLHIGGEYHDRRGVSLWFRGIWTLQPEPDPSLMASSPPGDASGTRAPTRGWERPALTKGPS